MYGALQFLPLSVTFFFFFFFFFFDIPLYFKVLSRTVDFAYVYVCPLLKEPEVLKNVSNAEMSAIYLLMKILENIVGGPNLFRPSIYL